MVLLGCLALWVTSTITGLDSTLVALLGLVALLHMGTLTWKDLSSNTNAVSNTRSLKSIFSDKISSFSGILYSG